MSLCIFSYVCDYEYIIIGHTLQYKVDDKSYNVLHIICP